MNYRFAWAARGFLATDQLTPTELDDRLSTWLRDTPAPAVKAQMNLVDSHDTGRILTACNGELKRVRQVLAFQLSYPGAPMIYYGGETGLEGDYAEDGRRTMPWDALDETLIGYFKQAIHFRKGSDALRLGEVEAVVIDDAQKVYAFKRWLGDEVVYCVFNASDETAEVKLPLLDGNLARCARRRQRDRGARRCAGRLDRAARCGVVRAHGIIEADIVGADLCVAQEARQLWSLRRSTSQSKISISLSSCRKMPTSCLNTSGGRSSKCHRMPIASRD